MTLPLTGQCFVVKPLDGSQPQWPGKPGNVFSFLVTLQNLCRHRAGKLFVDATMLFDLPHPALCIYHIGYVERCDCLATHGGRAPTLRGLSRRAG